VLTPGQDVHFRQYQPMLQTSGWEVITTAADEEDVKILCSFFDLLYTPEYAQLANWGLEGVTFNFDENGDPQYTDLIDNNPDGLSFLIANEMYLGGRNMGGLYEWTRELKEGTVDCMDAWSQADYDWVFPICATMNAEESYEFSSIMSDLQTYIEENIPAFIIGDKNMDADWDTFVETVKSMNIERAIELKQSQLDRYYARAN